MFPLPDLSDLPGWAQVVAYFILAVSLGTIVLVGRSGFIRGKAVDMADKKDHAEITMVSIDSKAVLQLADATVALNVTLSELRGFAAQYMDDLRSQRDEAELSAAELRGYERGRRARNRPPRKRVSKPGN